MSDQVSGEGTDDLDLHAICRQPIQLRERSFGRRSYHGVDPKRIVLGAHGNQVRCALTFYAGLDLSGIGRRRLRLMSTLAAIGLGHPFTDGPSGGLELASQIVRIAAGAGQLNHLSAELDWVKRTALRHWTNISRESVLGVHQQG